MAVIMAMVPSAVSAENVIELTDDTFDAAIGTDAVFAEFYASWCGHCKNLAPVYEELATAFKGKAGIKIVKIDADQNRAIGDKYEIKGFPTLKFFPAGSKTPEDYSGGRELEALSSFITEKTGIKASIEKPFSNVVELTDANFDEIVGKDKHVFVEFFAPWCGHCKKLAPIYEKLADLYATEDHCVIAKINAEENPVASKNFGIEGFPTLKFFTMGADRPIDYIGERSEEDLVTYVNQHCNSGRAVGGGFIKGYGTDVDAEKIFKKFIDATSEEESKAAKDEMAEFVKKNKLENNSGAYYFKVLDKIEKKGQDFVEKEFNRLKSLITTQKDTIDAYKYDSMHLRMNILEGLKYVITPFKKPEAREDL